MRTSRSERFFPRRESPGPNQSLRGSTQFHGNVPVFPAVISPVWTHAPVRSRAGSLVGVSAPRPPSRRPSCGSPRFSEGTSFVRTRRGPACGTRSSGPCTLTPASPGVPLPEVSGGPRTGKGEGQEQREEAGKSGIPLSSERTNSPVTPGNLILDLKTWGFILV